MAAKLFTNMESNGTHLKYCVSALEFLCKEILFLMIMNSVHSRGQSHHVQSHASPRAQQIACDTIASCPDEVYNFCSNTDHMVYF